MKDAKFTDNSNVMKNPDSVKLGFSDGATLEAPVGYSKPYEKIDVLHSFMGGNKNDFDASVGVMRQARESGDETLKLGAILNAITALDPSLGDVPNDYIIETFMGVGKSAKDAEQYIEDISKFTENSDENALADFDKLDADEQRKRVEANSPDLKRNKTVTGIYGIQTTVTEDNPDFDYEKAREEYRDMLEARNTFKTFGKLRNAGFDDRVIRDVLRFKTAFESRSAAADAYAENILTEDEEYVKQFMAAVNAFSPTVRRAFLSRVATRIAEDSEDSWGNIKDYLLDSNSDASIFYEQAKKMKLVDKDGNLVADEKKITIIKNFLADKNAAAHSYGFYGTFRYFDAQKLFNEGKKQFERRKLVRELMNANRTRFEKSGAVSETLEEALVNGFVSLEYLGLTLAVSAATGNPLTGVAASSAMMYLDEASNMYEDLRYDGNVDEATAAVASALYGVVASGLEQVQVRGLGRTFVGNKARYSNFREYVAYGIKESLKDLGKEAGVQTATELATSIDAYMTKKFAADFADATYDEEELFNEFRDECSMLVKTMPLITLGFWGAGAPYRARAHLEEVGAKIGSGVKAFFCSADILNNNAKSLGVIKRGEEYDAQIKSKYGKTERGREFLNRFFDAKDATQRDSVLTEYYPDTEKREEVKLELEAANQATREAQTEVIKRGLEIAKKRMEDDAALQNGDTVDISVLDGKDENGEYAVLESAIDSFGMRENVVFVESAQELSDASGVSLKTAEEQMSRQGAMGFTSMSNGKIIILKPHLRNGADALQTFVHEYGHKIMKSIRENDLGGYNRMCDDVLDILGGEGFARMTLPESYSNEKSIQYIADGRAVAEEILMRVVERVATKKAIDTKSRGVWARVKAWFKSLFDEKTFAEIADEKLAQMALDVLQREKKFDVNAADIKPSNSWRAKTPENNGEEVSGQWQVADVSELLTSTDEGFDDKLQPRNRSRQASKEQTSEIAVNLDPERLNDSVTSDLGAPIVDSRGMVLSGNGRTLAIRQAYASEKSERADVYRQFVERRAHEMGIEIPDNVKNPVLVRRVDNFGKMSAEEFAARSNKSQVAGMSVAEQAIADGRRILAADLLDYFFPDANGNVLASSNMDFVNAFLEQVGGSEMYRNSDGSVRSNLSPRIKAAVLAAMLDSDNRETVERLLDNPEGFNALVGGLMQSAANLAELSSKPEYDISDELSQAVELFVEMRNKGMNLADFSAQGDFFRAAPSDEVMFLMGLFEENSKTPSGISGVLRQYAGECKKIDTTTMDMFGTENPSKLEKLEQARDHYAADIAQQDANADLRGKYEEVGPTPEEIREAQGQPNLFEKLKNLQGESVPVENLEENTDLDYYFEYFKKNLLEREIQTPIGKVARFNLGHFNKLIARGENKGESEEVSSLKEWVDKIENHEVDLTKNPPKGFDYARARNMPLVIDVLEKPQFVLVDTDDTLLFVKKYGDKTYLWCSVMNNGETLGIKSWRPLRLTRNKCGQLKIVYTKENGVVNLAQPRESQHTSGSTNLFENQEKNSRLRFLLRQERTENPVIWASIVLAKEIYLGRRITASKLETVLPSSKFDGTKREYAITRAREIANRYKINKEKFGEKLDLGLQRAENDLYWRRDVMDEMYASFRADGEEYGYIKARLKEWLKNERRRDLEKIRGLKSDEIGFDVAAAIENAMDAEPERPKPSEKQEETEDEDLDEAETSGGGGAELSDNQQTDERFDTRGIIAKIRMAATKTAKQKDLDEPARRRLYRNTLVETLTDAAKKLSFGIERERILKEIDSLSKLLWHDPQSLYQRIIALNKLEKGSSEYWDDYRNIQGIYFGTNTARNSVMRYFIEKYSENQGEIPDVYSIFAEHIAMRIFNRGVWDSKKALLEKFESIVRHIKAPKRVERDDKRNMAGKAQERAHLIKQIAHMPLNSDDKTIKSVEGEIENALTAINRADSDIANDYHAKLMDAVRYLEDLQRFGALREKSRAEMAEAVDWLEKYIEDETAAQEDKVEKLKADAEHRRKVFVEAINEISRNAAFDGKARESLRLLFNSASTFKDLLLGLGRAATGEKYREFKGLVDSMMDACYAATAQKENEVFRHQEELTKAVSEIYGMKPADAFKHILGGNAELQKFSVQGKPMSVQIALQRLSEAEQGNYRNNVFQHCVGKSKDVVALEERIAELKDEEPTEAVRTQVAELELQLESLKRDAVERYAEELRGALSERDLRLLDWFREFYRRERPSLSNANEIITGLGIPEADPFYTPMKMLREGGTNEKHQVVAIVPKSLSPRVPNSLDIDESFGIVDIWNDRVNENAHYKAFSQLNIQWRGIFAHADFHKAVAAKLGKNVLTQVLDHFNDIMSVNLGSGLKIDTIDKLNGVYAIAALGFNLGSGLRQMTGTPAFANFIGVKKSLEYAKSCLSKEGRRAAVEILNSETAKRRMQNGNNQILVEALNNIDGNKFWGWYKRNAMFFNKWGDIIPIITIGQGIYRAKTEEYAKTLPLADAKKKAMDEMWAIAEASQQSPSVMNMGTWQRRGGSFGKMAGLFISSPQLMLSREIEAFNRFNEVRKKYKAAPKNAAVRADYLAARKELAKTFLINHVLVQGGYMLATVLWKGLLGDDWDDDDWAAIIAESIAGPFGGLVVFGRFVSAIYSNYSVSVAPIEGFGRTLKSSADLFLDLIKLDGDEMLKDLDRIGKSLFSPYRDASKIYKNATDDKEGIFW